MVWIIASLMLLLAFIASFQLFNQSRASDMAARSAMHISLIAAWLFITVLGVVHQISAGHVGLVYSFGNIVDTRPAGLQYTMPWQSVAEASTQVVRHKFDKLTTFSKESQDVFMQATINVEVSPEHVTHLYTRVGPSYYKTLVEPRVYSALKDETVKYSTVDVAPNRENIRVAVRTRLTNELRAYSIIVEDFLMDDVDFPPKFKAAIEEKQIATQTALAEEQRIQAEKHKAQQMRERTEGEADSKLIMATKEAQANEMLMKSLTPTLIQYFGIQKLNPNVSVMMVPPNIPFIMDSSMMKK